MATITNVQGGGNPTLPEQTTRNAPAQIVIGDVDIEEGQTDVYVNEEDSLAIYTDYMIENKFEGDLHRYMMGISSPNGFQGASVAFVQLAADTLLWICDWTGCRFNKPPVIPSLIPADPNWVLLDKHYTPVSLNAGPNGTPLYRMSGVYVYGHKNPNVDTLKNIAFGRPPWLQDKFTRIIQTGSEEKSLIDSMTTTLQGSVTLPGGVNVQIVR